MKSTLQILLLLLISTIPAMAGVHSYQVTDKDIFEGYVVRQIPVQIYGKPDLKLVQIAYEPISELPKGVKPGNAQDFVLRPGILEKKPFVLIRIPAFRLNAEGKPERLSAFMVDINEASPQPAVQKSYAKVTGTTSPLASGTWYKIAVPTRGVYKIDAAFLQSLGISGSVSSNNIRLVGNGGTLLSEDNAVPRPLDLTENAIWMNDGGDGNFSGSDFFAFFCPGTTRWDKDSLGQRFIHIKNIYADSSYYFLSVDAGTGMRISDAPVAGSATVNVSSFNDYAVHDEDFYNPGKFGKTWWGEKFGISSNALPNRTFTFPLSGVVDSLWVRISVSSRAVNTGNSMSVTLNGSPFDNYIFDAVLLDDDQRPVSPRATDKRILFNGNSAQFDLAYNAAPEAIGYMNFIELNWRRPLSFDGNNFAFRDWKSVGKGAVAQYSIGNANGSSQVWDVSNPTQPLRMQGNLNGSTYTFNGNTDWLHEYVALDGNSFSTPISRGRVENQNLHGADAPRLVIVAFPDFMDAANRLAEHHRQRDGMNVLVASTTQVYNEFSSGGQDICGIRDMMRYFYLRAGTDTSQMPRYLLLFGDASYDYKSRLTDNSNYVPTFESSDSIAVEGAYTVDDFYGFLDDNEHMDDFSIANTLDIGIGRLPVNNETQAEAAVDKILAYHDPASFGPWRLLNTYIGDNEDNAGEHELDAEDIAATVDTRSPFTNATKIYLDNLPFVSTPGGERCPQANKAINDQIFKGSLLLNYTGHGSITTLAHERILTKDDFSQWKNLYKMPFMVTATCDYARYDNPAYVSNGEAMILKADGGTIAMLTTTGPVYAGINRDINQQFLSEQYTQHNGVWPTFGDAIRSGKNITFTTTHDPGVLINFYRFTLLGDPALQPAFPVHVVKTEDIIDTRTGNPTDSMRALGKYQIRGLVSDVQGNLLSNFNGRAYVTIYDKPRLVQMITKETNALRSYYIRDNVIFKGITNVSSGHFSISFIAPKDINYDFGKARISYYAENGATDAAGMDTTVTAGGFYDGAEADNKGPIVEPFMGDEMFRDGGLTGSNTLLYVRLTDSSGINVSGNSVGHDLTAVLDGDEEHPYILNDYYESENGTYKRGHASFPISGLSDGSHTFVVKAWDVYNNSGTGTVHFVVGDGKLMQVQNLMNYPNPFKDKTYFFFEHNHPDQILDVQIAIYDLSGKQARILKTSADAGGSHGKVEWDGTADNGAMLPSGMYVYRMILTTPTGVQSTAYQKLVIIR
jgi:hypothetical protein